MLRSNYRRLMFPCGFESNRRMRLGGEVFCSDQNLKGQNLKDRDGPSLQSKHDTSEPMLVYCCTSVADGGPTLNQLWLNVLCLLFGFQTKWIPSNSICWFYFSSMFLNGNYDETSSQPGFNKISVIYRGPTFFLYYQICHPCKHKTFA